MLLVLVSLMPAPSTLNECVIVPLFLILNVTLPVFFTDGFAGVILNSVSERLTVLPPPELAGALFVAEPPLLLLVLLLLLLPHPATARAPTASTAIDRCALIRTPGLAPAGRWTRGYTQT